MRFIIFHSNTHHAQSMQMTVQELPQINITHCKPKDAISMHFSPQRVVHYNIPNGHVVSLEECT